MNIPQAAVDAVAETYEQIADEDHEYRDLIGIDWTIIRDGLEAAMPHIRTQIARDIRAEMVGRNWNKTFLNGLEYGAYIAEKEENQ